MNDNKLLCSLFLAPAALILLLIFFSSTASAATASGPSLLITTAKIPNTEFSNGYATYGNYVVWADKRNGQDKPDIYMYDISTHKETRITTSGSVSYPAIYKNRIVWLDNRNGNDSDSNYEDYDIYMYDISTHKETRITNSSFLIDDVVRFCLSFVDNRIIWGGPYDYRVYDLSTRKETNIKVPISDPEFSGNRMVGVSDIDGRPSNIYVYDLSTNETTKILTSDENRSGVNPDIYDDKIVWQMESETSSDIYLYNISTHKETRIATHGGIWPAIFGDKILWFDWINENEVIYMYDLSTNTETHTAKTSIPSPATFYGDKIVWTDNSNGNIYVGTLVSSPIASFTASKTSGIKPLTVKFTDKSTGSPTSWIWNFGDKTPNSISKSPTHKYTKAGKYTVSLTVKNKAGSNIKKMSNYITVK